MIDMFGGLDLGGPFLRGFYTQRVSTRSGTPYTTGRGKALVEAEHLRRMQCGPSTGKRRENF